MKTMKNLKWLVSGRRVAGLLAGFVMATASLQPAYASDTEVYARRVELTGATAPVLMMVLDTSDNMTLCMTSTSSCLDATGAPTYNSRVATLGRVMQKALYGNADISAGAIIKPAPGYLHIGYARFLPGNNGGGWVRYPADKKLDDTVAFNYSNVQMLRAVPDSPSDATVSSLGVATTTATTFAIGNNNPDVAVRFANVRVPKNATITSATLTFTESANGQTPSISVASEATDDAADFSATNMSVSRIPASGSFSSGTYSSGAIDVTSQVQSVVNRSGWCGTNALSLWVRSGGSNKTATVYSFDGAPTAAAQPQLKVTYSVSAANMSNSCTYVKLTSVVPVSSGLDDVEWPESGSTTVSYAEPTLNPALINGGIRNVVGLRFANVPVGAGARITGATLYTTGFSQSLTAAPVNVTVDAINGNVGAMCTRNATTNAVSCAIPTQTSITAHSTTWSYPSTPVAPATTVTTTDSTNYAVDVTQQVNDIVSGGSWGSGNAMLFRLYNSSATGTSSPLGLSSIDAGSSKSPMLQIYYEQRVTDLSTAVKTVRQDLTEDLTSFLASNVGGMASLGNTYAEAAHYMLGQAVFTNATATVNGVTYTQPDSRTVITGSSPLTYKTPVGSTSDCSANYVYMMSDGVPNDASGVQNNSAGDLTGSSLSCSTYLGTVASGGNNQKNFSCMMSVAEAMSTSANTLKKSIRTNTVLFGPSPPDAALKSDLNSIAVNHGAGKYYDATDEATLLQSLLDTLTALIDVSGSITAPGVAVNQFNRLTNLDQLYYAVFDPETLHARWLGNVKRYQLTFTSTGAQITDVNGNNAIDPVTTFFSTSAKSWWSPSVDGNKVVLGGAASVLPAPTSRTIYTNVSNATTLENLNGITAAAGATFMGFSNNNQFTNMRNWMLGYDINIVDNSTTPAQISTTLASVGTSTKLRYQLGGVLHAQPILINYGYFGTDPLAAVSDASLQDNTVYFSDMEGMLHGINTATGTELFSFIPRELLKRESNFIIDPAQNLPEFGLDLTWTAYRLDNNVDYKITAGSSGDKVYLFGGMRMGGSNYYALDVTSRTAPSLKWQITGGTSTNFTKLGQTWSKPVLGKVKIGGVVKTVMFVGGGYDTKHETAGYVSPTNDADQYGNQVYIIDPETGAVLWWASNVAGASMNDADLKFSIPSELKTLDKDNDGLVDTVYFGDLGGQVFRLDLDNGNAAASGLGKGIKMLANVGQGYVADTLDQRRFYELPSVAIVKDPNTNKPYVAIAMGSGYRSHPLDTGTQDMFFVFRDFDVLGGTNAEATITPDLMQTVDLSTSAGVAASTTSLGWRIILPETGEKVLSAAIILFNEVYFTTYVPDMSSTTSCAPVIGRSKLWRMSVLDASATFDLNHDGSITAADRTLDNVVQGLGGSPELIVGEGGKNAVITGTNAQRNTNFKTATPVRIRWYEKTQ